MKKLLKEIEERRAYRALSETPVDKAAIDRMMTAATYAPSCFNSQPWRLMVVKEKENLVKIHGALSGGNYWAKKAPVIVVIATKISFDATLSDNREYALYGCGLACANLILQATHEGLYAHPMAGFDPLEIKKLFSIPEDYIVINLVAIGHPGSLDGLSEKHVASEKSERNRKPAEEVICHEGWEFD